MGLILKLYSMSQLRFMCAIYFQFFKKTFIAKYFPKYITTCFHIYLNVSELILEQIKETLWLELTYDFVNPSWSTPEFSEFLN